MTGTFPEAWRRGVYEAIFRRRDIREFRSDPVPDGVLARILRAAHHAGSVGFMQPWDFVVVRDPELRRRFREHVDAVRLREAEAFRGSRRERYLSYKLEGILEAPVGICVTCDPRRFGPAVLGRTAIPETDLYSTCAAIQNLWLAARVEGVGVGWVSLFDPAELRRLLGIPEPVVPVAWLCVGYPKEFPDRPMLEATGWLPRVPLAAVVHAERWGEPPPQPLRAAIEAAGSEAAGEDREPSAPRDSTREGLFLVFTGPGKGKTTAALGLVFRALGHGLRAAVVQFVKGRWMTGERRLAARIENLDFFVCGRGFTWRSDDLSRDREAATRGLAQARELLRRGAHDIVVLDEITYPIHYGFVSPAEVLEALRGRARHVHVVATGRHAPPELCDAADVVTEMGCRKHPFERGRRAARGVDY